VLFDHVLNFVGIENSDDDAPCGLRQFGNAVDRPAANCSKAVTLTWIDIVANNRNTCIKQAASINLAHQS